MMLRRYASSIYLFLLISFSATAAPLIGVRVETRCQDETILFLMSQEVTAVFNKSTSHKLVQDKSEIISLRFMATLIKQEGSSFDKPPAGIALAVLGMRKNSNGNWDVFQFSNEFLSATDLKKAIRESINESFKQKK